MADSVDTGHIGAYRGWTVFNSAHHEDIELAFLEGLRHSYPEYHVVRTEPTKFDVLGYAAAGHAVAIRQDSRTVEHVVRSYQPPPTRLQELPAKLHDDVKFARWDYIWESQQYIIYKAQYATFLRQNIDLLCVLAPMDSVSSAASELDGEHPAIESLLLAVGAWSSDLHDEIFVFDDTEWKKDKELYESVQGASWDQVIMDPRMKSNLISDVQGFFDNRALYESLEVPWKRGIILHGVPGNGKTISLKALINALSKRPDPVPSLYVKNFDDSYYGPKHSIRSIFKKARTMAPCLLIFEDLDSLVTNKVRSYFLNEVDGLESNNGVLMIGTTNHLDKLDPAISKRPSRFDRKYHFKIPSQDEREAYAEFWRRKLKSSDHVAFPQELCPIIAKLTEGFSFAYLKELFIVALLSIAQGTDENEEEQVLSSSSTDDGIVVEKEEIVEGQDTAETVTEKAATQPAKKAIPEVEVSKELQDNLLLKVIINQAKILLDEMDNSDTDANIPPKVEEGLAVTGRVHCDEEGCS